MADIARHAQVALRMRQQLDGVGDGVRAAILDDISHGIFVAGVDETALYANREARAWSGLGGLALGPRAQILTSNPDTKLRLSELVGSACRGGAGGSLCLESTCGGPNFAVTVGPLTVPFVRQLHLSRRLKSGVALITQRRMRTEPKIVTTQVMDVFGLSRSEAALLPLLLMGETAEGIAGQRGVSVHTIRSQVRSILNKTGAPNLRALGVLVGSLT